MCKAFGVAGYDDPRVATIVERAKHRDLMRDLLQQCYAAAGSLTVEQGMAALDAHKVPCGVVVSPADLAHDRHAQAIGLLEESVHPVAGKLRQPRHPAQFGALRPALGGPAPMLGEHTDAILGELGLGDRIADLRANGVVA